MITLRAFQGIVKALDKAGYARDDIAWSITSQMPTCADDFAREVIYVICNSGMKNTIARKIFNKVMNHVTQGGKAGEMFFHTGKAQAIDYIVRERKRLFRELRKRRSTEDVLLFCESLPWIGQITKYHLAKNFGAQVAKPDVHLQRLADREKTTPQKLCERLARESGYKVATVDILLWRACAVGIISSLTGKITRDLPELVPARELREPTVL